MPVRLLSPETALILTHKGSGFELTTKRRTMADGSAEDTKTEHGHGSRPHAPIATVPAEAHVGFERDRHRGERYNAERTLQAAWPDMNSRHGSTCEALDGILGEFSTARDARVAGTVIQWLGSSGRHGVVAPVIPGRRRRHRLPACRSSHQPIARKAQAWMESDSTHSG
jgi:hypothetical protein